MQIYSIHATEPNFSGTKTNLAKKAARKAASYSKKVTTAATITKKQATAPTTTPILFTATTLAAQAATMPFTMQDAIDKNYFKLGRDENGNLFQPDVFQKAAGIQLAKGEDVLVTAPTGTGKTAIAHFVISKNMAEGKRTLYTTPLKALSNEKFRDFEKIYCEEKFMELQNTYGKENVGIITGDVKKNETAPIVILTTEIYRNMVFKSHIKNEPCDGLKNVKTVIFDELHYIGDIDRGGIWEQSIMFTPPEIQLLSLSATIGNKTTITDWMASIRNIGSKYIAFNKQKDLNEEDSTQIANGIKGLGTKNSILIDVPEENRHVPLEFSIYKGEVSSNSHRPKGKISKAEKRKNERAQTSFNKSLSVQPSTSTYCNLVDDLCEADRLPAIIYIFSKNRCERVLNALKTRCECLNDRDEIHQIYETICRYEAEGKYLGEGLDKEALYRGYAIHNAGMLPVQKELIEELGQRKLIKVILATETLAAGINMPARTTVISAVRKPSDHPDGDDGMREITNSEGKQMFGRAGRRGKDKKGYCYGIACTNAQANKLKDVFYGKPNKLRSNFIPDYSFLANYYNICSNDDKLNDIMSKSLYVYDTDPKIKEAKQEKLFKEIEKKKEVMRKLEFINLDNTLTKKGELLQHINGYLQLPIVEILHSGILNDMDSVQLAGFLGLLANMEKSTNNNEQGTESGELQIADRVLKNKIKILKSILNKYTLVSGEMVNFDTDTAQNIYRFAELNSVKGSDSVENWSYMYNFDIQSEIDYEGQLFREITMTIDLIKQLYNTIDAELSGRSETYEEAAALKAKLLETIDLIKRDPVKI